MDHQRISRHPKPAVSGDLKGDECPGSGEVPLERDHAVATARIASLRAYERREWDRAAAIEAGTEVADMQARRGGVWVVASAADLDPATARRKTAEAIVAHRDNATAASGASAALVRLRRDRRDAAFLRDALPATGDMVKAKGIIVGLPFVMPGQLGIVHEVARQEGGTFIIGTHWSNGVSNRIEYPANRVEIVDAA